MKVDPVPTRRSSSQSKNSASSQSRNSAAGKKRLSIASSGSENKSSNNSSGDVGDGLEQAKAPGEAENAAGENIPQPDVEDEDKRKSESDDEPNNSDSDDHDEEEEDEEEEEIEDATKLSHELQKFGIHNSHLQVTDPGFLPGDFPDTYRQNSLREKLVLAYAENYRRQYVHLYRDRKPLMLAPLNEMGVQKFVCTTIRPVELPYKELYEWKGAADFVADYLNYIPLSPAHELPRSVYSPSTVLRRQLGNCFEYSTLLTSLLIGVGYDAYVVSGYAVRETTILDQNYDICPLLIPPRQEEKAAAKPDSLKYLVKPPKDLRSKFDAAQEQKRLQIIEDQKQRLKEIEDERIRLSELPPDDPLHGMRIHSWVLVLAGRREVAESFYIEPTTGLSHPLNTELYLAIESIWNHRNYWTNMQDPTLGIAKINYDLGDCALWEYMFPSNERPELLLPADAAKNKRFEDLEQEEEKEDDIERHMDLPPSWTQHIVVSPTDFEKRCPGGKKTIYYKRAKLEQFAPYLLKDGLVSRLSIYEDIQRTILTEVRERYNRRADKLRERRYDYVSGWILEKFDPGRARHLKEHHYKVGGIMPESDRTLIYYDNARFDGLSHLIDSPLSLTQQFINRDDFLSYRHIQFGVRQKKFGPSEATPRPIEVMVERFERNRSKPADDDIEEIIYNIVEGRVQVRYHRADTRISATTREFVKPPNTDDKGHGIPWNPDHHVSFLADPAAKEKRKVELYEMMMSLLRSEAGCIERAREGEHEIRDSLDERLHEEAASELEVSIFDTERNDKAVKHRAQLERQREEARLQSDDTEQDYLAPLMAQYDSREPLTKEQALKIREDALTELKQRIVERANIIQSRYEKVTGELQKKQAWYQANQVSMKRSDEQEYLDYCSNAMFKIHVLELRLNRHKEMAPLKYRALEKRIRDDPRLAEHFR